MITELVSRKGIVLATGGGAVESEEIRKALRHNGLVVYLHASIDMQMDRTRNSKNRPMLNTGADRREILEDLMLQREPLYRQEADVIYETDGRSPQTAAREIAGEVRKHWQY